MARGMWMQRFARWHIWLGWLIGVPLLLWTTSGVVMVLKPIEEVRGNDRRVETPQEPLRGNPAPIAFRLDGSPQVVDMRTFVQRGVPITLVTRPDGTIERFDARTGTAMPPVGAAEARTAIAALVRGGDRITAMRAYPASAPPLELRKPVPVWQATLADGTHVYLNRQTGEIEAIRTRWWRIYDVMWGLHIMDLQTREEAHNPFTIGLGILAFLGALIGVVLLFRRRRARPNR